MSGLEAVGSVIGVVSVALSALSLADVRSAYSPPRTNLIDRVREDGLIMTFLLRTVLSDALHVMERVERFNMIGVAGAIIAQVAISAISLNKLEDSHWTAQAFFVVSLTTGTLAVFFSCAANPVFHGLHSEEDIKDFLTKPTPDAERKDFRDKVLRIEPLFKQATTLNPEGRRYLDEHWEGFKVGVEGGRWKVASPYAALMLVAPMILLKIALSALLTGLGIYLGKLCTARLVPSYGSGSIGILVFYLASALFGLAIFFGPQRIKLLDDVWLKRWLHLLNDYERSGVSKTSNVLRDAMAEMDVSQPPVKRALSPQPIIPTHNVPVQKSMHKSTTRAQFHQSTHSRHGGRVHYSAEDQRLEVKSAPACYDKGHQAILERLIKAHEESLEATRQLLGLHGTRDL